EDLPDTTPPGSNTASYSSGFPPITMTIKSAGGLPPKGQDMNQALFELSALNRWNSAGGPVVFDSAFSTTIGGYPKGAIIQGDDATTQYLNTLDGNTSNPNTGGAGWRNVSEGRLIGVVTITTSGTYTPTPGTKSIVVEVQGAGGAGGAAGIVSGANIAMGGGGSAGAYAVSRLISGFSGLPVTIGAKGSGRNQDYSGKSGGATSFGTITAAGGIGGQAIGATPPFVVSAVGGATASGGNIVNITGSSSLSGIALSASSATSGTGGSSPLGSGGGPRSVTIAGDNASGFGAGGSGAINRPGATGDLLGGDGSNGVVIVWEYA
ncbi:hypothetical protein ACOKA8_003490, partial [Citrobacter freundii]